MADLDIRVIPALSDNYIYLIHDRGSGETAVLDPGEAAPVMAALDQTGWKPGLVLNTHHHGDHIDGNASVTARSGAELVGPEADRHRIPGMMRGVRDGDTVQVGQATGHVIEVPGHTSGHIAFWFESAGVLFAGDTLFALGCGRILEGNGPQMWHSLKRLKELPADTLVYCGHEYTLANARFARSVDPDNRALADRAEEVAAARRANRPTIPSCLGDELQTNPFLRADDPAMADRLGMAGRDPAAVFTELRRMKDGFRG